MMRKIIIPILILLTLAAENCLAKAAALATPMATLGPGMTRQQTGIDALNFRTGSAHFSYSGKQPENIFFIQQENSLRNSAIADYHPWTDGGFRISAGLFYNDEIHLVKSSAASSHNVLPYSDELEQQSVAPYFGLGWGVAPASESSWIFTLDVGLIYQGQDAEFSSAQCRKKPFSGQCADHFDNGFDMQELQYAIERYGLYPVLSAGVTFKF